MISVVIHTHNEEKNISECIDSARLLSSDIVVVDMESEDSTVSIVKKKKVKLLTFPFSHYVEPAREFGIKQSKGDWVFILDADERITPQLANTVKSHISGNKTPSKFDSFEIARKNIFGKKKWLQYGGWWPDYQIRLIKRNSFKKWPKAIHSTPSIRGNLGSIEEPIVHYFHGNFETMVQKTETFEDIESSMLYEAKRSVGILTFFRKFFGGLYRRLFRDKGYKDGKIGIIESIYQAYSKTITYLFLYEKYQTKKTRRAV